MFVLENFGAKQRGSNAFITRPGGEWMKNSDKFAGRNFADLKSYDQTAEYCLTMLSRKKNLTHRVSECSVGLFSSSICSYRFYRALSRAI